MLRYMRRNAKSWIVKLVFFVIIVVFCFWGVGSMKTKKQNMVASVNGSVITHNDFGKAYQRLVQRYQEQYKDQFNAELAAQLRLKEQTLNSLVDRQLMLDFASRYKLQVSDDELRGRIATMAAFQNNGLFDQQLYQQLLSYNRLTPAEFETSLRDDLLIDKISNLIRSGAKTAPFEIEQQYLQQQEKISLMLVKLKPEQYLSDAALDAAELQNYFTENRETFRVPEKRQIRVVTLDHAVERREIHLDDGEIAAYYNEHRGDFMVPEKVKARHILLKVAAEDPQDAWDKAHAQALELVGRLQSGKETFAELAKEYSQGPSAPRGGDLGWFARGAMVKPFEDAAFRLQAGEYTRKPVRTMFGYHLVQVDERQAAHTRSLEEVRGEIEAKIIDERLPTLVSRKIDNLASQMKDVEPDQFMAKLASFGLTAMESEFFAQNEPIAGIGNVVLLAAKVFATPVGSTARVENTLNKSYFFLVSGKQESFLPELTQVKDEVEHAYRLAMARVKVKNLAADILARAGDGVGLEEVAGQAKLTVDHTGLFPRGRGFIPTIGVDQQLSKRLFALYPERPLYPEPLVYQDMVFLAQLEERKTTESETEAAALREDLASQLHRYREFQALNNFYTYLRQEADIAIAPGVLEE
ncbi:MAG: SurA N-terminal domain-containing protein [Deltaproteobacteria bacterium]|nr:SurA N-terminal domain-containing protein [Candidatus Anaeroferrophillus wilburensis]MBN2888858.1 SurA N-terminal domain-containing protein [Deltaproteobacteria bacterium]